MTYPIGQGPSSWARTTRLAELEWGMSRKRILAMFSSAQTYPAYERTHRRTNEPVVIRECVGFAVGEPTHGVKMFGSATFDESDQLDSITLRSEFPRPEEVTDEHLRVAANEVAAAVGAGALPTLAAGKWKVHRTQIELDRDEDGFWFELGELKRARRRRARFTSREPQMKASLAIRGTSSAGQASSSVRPG